MHQQKEATKLAEREKRIVEKMVQEVMSRIGKRQKVDAETILESLHKDTMVVQRCPSFVPEEDLPPAEVPLPSLDGTDYGSTASEHGAGGGGRQPPRRRTRRGGSPSSSSSSSSSDSSSDSDGFDPDKWLRRSLGKTTKKIQKRQISHAILGRLLNPREPAEPSKLAMDKPEKFTGEDESLFRAWCRAMEEWMDVNKKNFSNDKTKIYWVGSMLRKKARVWHQARQDECTRMHIEDNWKAYSSAIQERFIDEEDLENDEEKMRELKYEGDIKDFITRLDVLNGRVGMHGVTFRSLVKRALPTEITRMIFSRAGGIPKDDTAFMAVVKEAGYTVERMKRETSRKN
jgi:hypothetical protein